MKYNQCTMMASVGFRGKTTYTAYIPTKYAIKGKLLKLKINDKWENGWEVISVGPQIDEKCLPDAHAEVKAHRKRTGDSMPKKA